MVLFKRSAVAVNKLHQQQWAVKCEERQLISDCATRWNSTGVLVHCLLQEKQFVELTLKDTKGEFNLQGSQWDLMEELASCLKVLEIATTTLGFS